MGIASARVRDSCLQRPASRTGQAVGLSSRGKGIPSFHRAVAVIGVSPLIQYLTPFPGGRLQVINPAYAPKTGDWFDIYKGEPRGPHEWGFWKNGDMNWSPIADERVRKGRGIRPPRPRTRSRPPRSSRDFRQLKLIHFPPP